MSEKLSTILAHAGDWKQTKKLNALRESPEVLPVYMTSVFAFDDTQSVDDVYEGVEDGYIYSRMRHPNNDAVAEVLAAADGAEEGLVFSSGMSAILLSILAVIRSGDHVVSSPVLYGGVRDFLENELPRFGVEVSFVDFGDPHVVAQAVRPNTKVLYTETISNPLMAVPDLEAISAIAHAHGAQLFVDNTFASPVVAQPLRYGADLVLYSATKYLGGHSDLVGGAAVGSKDLIGLVRKKLTLYGATLGAAESWLLARSLRTLELRVTRQSETALRVAKALEAHPAVERVYYPGLPSNADHAIAERLFREGRYGGMLGVELRGGEEAAVHAIDHLGFIKYVPSLAGTATSVSYPARTSHRAFTPEALREAGISRGLLRFSIGLEDADEIIAQITQALEKDA
ncbi:MAG: aminotransferase class I/II-fold pyridoxal phosphate-dependent enzyme [Clostridia bacterium]|nr:aminotransferase class I/II-fold pyridoxal phosphate-dependent enzyme [Clostridia bacterium]